MVDAACDDVFGYTLIDDSRTSRRLRGPYDGASVKGGEFRINIPQHLVQLLNKETETERLQDLYLAIVGIMNTAGDSVHIDAFWTIRFHEERKTVTVR
jgi:hypothetical protein